jgi:hypothetical protein
MTISRCFGLCAFGTKINRRRDDSDSNPFCKRIDRQELETVLIFRHAENRPRHTN